MRSAKDYAEAIYEEGLTVEQIALAFEEYARQRVEAFRERAISTGKWWVPEDQHGSFADAIRALPL